MVRHRALRTCAAALLIALTGVSARAELQVEIPKVAEMPPPNPYRIFLSDVAIGHIVDGRLHVIDGDGLRYLGMVATGYAGQAILSPDRREIYVATTYYSRLSSGVRTDTVDIHDAQTLVKTGEIIIPPIHAQALHYKGTIRPSADGRWLYVLNATPAVSVTVIDLKARKVASQVDIPGCWILLPPQSASDRFSTICGDGTMLTVTHDGEGREVAQRKSAAFFDPDADPIFIHGEQDGDTYRFVSYGGDLYTAHVGGEVASFEPKWPLLTERERKAGWRPGGYQLLAQHKASGRVFVGMHDGAKAGSHKSPAKEIWSFDLKTRKRIARAPGSNAIALAVSQGDRPRLFAYDGVKGGLAVYDAAAALKPAGRMDGVGETPSLMELH
ncbi:amine dehydrogenase large subunit [Thauera sinica]|uniref:Amine dehydrogenase large subunit n=1 Tax=Thauera sinica TaxID=2665146 RepID=A0ABW1AZ85_9RHOO